MKKKLVTTLMLVLILASTLAFVTPVAAADPYELIPASPQPGDNHFDVNYITSGKIAFTSSFDGSTTPTVPPLYWHDDFDDGNANGWTTLGTGGTWAVEDDDMGEGISKVYSQSDTAYTTTSTHDTYWRSFTGDTGWSDYEVEAKIKVVNGGFAPIGGIFFRVQGFTPTSDYYLFRIDGRQIYGLALLKSPNTPIAPYVNFEVTMGQVYNLKVIVSGSNIKCYVDDVLKIEVTDTSYVNGAIGVGTFNAHTHFDDIIVRGPLDTGQTWDGDGPWYYEDRTIIGTVTAISGGPIAGSLTILSTTHLNAQTGTGTTSGTFTFTGSSGGFSGTISATNTNFGVLSGTFVSTSAWGIYSGQMIEGPFTGNFYESNPGISGYDSFIATLTGVPDPNEVLILKYGTSQVDFVMGDNFAILDSDAGVFDGDEALVQLPHEWYYEIFDQPRGKPKGSLVVATWHYSFYRPKGKPVWYAHYGPARGAGKAYNERLYVSDGSSWPTFVINDGCTNLATRWYYFDTYLSA